MLKKSTRSMLRLTLLILPLLLLGGCAILPQRPMLVEATASPRIKIVRQVGTEVAISKTFVLDHDWNFSGAVMRRGASITFTPDGRGAFSCVVYREPFKANPIFISASTSPIPAVARRYSYQAGDVMRFSSVQHRRDGNILFQFPAREPSYFTMVRPDVDYPYDVTFGFDRRQYDEISTVRFVANTELLTSTVARGSAN